MPGSPARVARWMWSSGRAAPSSRPLQDVRLIVVDESHDPSYKQEVVPRYHAVAVAAARMRLESGMLLLGSATPSLESYAAAKQGRIALLEMRERATAQPLPAVQIVDLRSEFESGNRAIFSDALVQALGDRLERNEKSILFVNRRGSAGSLICRTCGSCAALPPLQHRALGASRGRTVALPLLRFSEADRDAYARRAVRKASRRSASARSGSSKKLRGSSRMRESCEWIPIQPRASGTTRAF